MITTPQEFLEETSRLLNEPSAVTTSQRIGYFNRAMRRVKKVRKWSWNKKTHDLTVVANTQEYLLTTSITDYNPQWGLYEVFMGGEKMTPLDYTKRASGGIMNFYLKSDAKTIGFCKTLDGTENIDIVYFPRHTKSTSTSSTLDPEIPEDMLGSVCLLMKMYVHDGKRQRVDARNALIDYKEEIGEDVLQDASNKAKDMPRQIPTPLTYFRVRRNYRF